MSIHKAIEISESDFLFIILKISTCSIGYFDIFIYILLPVKS